MFVCRLLASVLAFASVYKRLGNDIGKRFDTATAQTLVLQKLRSYDDADISVGRSGDIAYLGFTDMIDGDKYITYIYAYGGELYRRKGQQYDCFTITYDGVLTSSHYSLRGGKAVGV